MRLIPFEVLHAEELIAGELSDERNRPSFGVRAIENLIVPEMSFSGIHYGHLVFSGGIAPLWEGVGEAWILGADRVPQHTVAVARICKRYIYRIAKEQKLHRVQAHMKSDWPELSRWASFLGMQHEGTVRQMTTKKENYELYSVVSDGS